jgi:hypothetical protein
MHKLVSSTINNALPNTHERDRTINNGFQYMREDYWPSIKAKLPPSSELRALTDWLVSEQHWRLPHSKIWSWVLWDIKPRVTVLARASSNVAISELRRGATNVPPTQKDRPLHSSKGRLQNTYMSRREQKSWSENSMRTEAKNDCAGEDQQQFKGPTEASSDLHL